MHPDDVIAVMRHQGWLIKEPNNVKEFITSSVRYMMVRSQMNSGRLAREMGVSPKYIRRKLTEDHWMLRDLDKLPDIFGYEPHDYVQGYQHMAGLGMAELDENEPPTEAEEQEHE